MTRRILLAIVVVAALSVTAFGVPLALAVRRVERSDAVSSLQRAAARAAAELPVHLLGPDKVEVPRTLDGDDVSFAVYDASGKRIAGRGPASADPVVRAALTGRLAQYSDASQISVGWPLTSNERTYGALRAALPDSGIERRIQNAWLLMAGLGTGVVAVAALLAWWLSRRLARPVHALASAANQLGEQDFTVSVSNSGVPELDRAGQALTTTAGRLGRLLARERSFSADASHQLRTPLTGLRLILETSANSDADARGALEPALREVERLEATVDDLLRLARADRPHAEPVDISAILEEVVGASRGLAARDNRPVRLDLASGLPTARIAPEALRQVLDVLLANAMQHGAGTIRVRARATPGGVAVEVHDEGPGIDGDPEAIFARGTGRGHGIGLALARSLAEAEGCRLTLVVAGPGPTFRLLIPAGPEDRQSAGS